MYVLAAMGFIIAVFYAAVACGDVGFGGLANLIDAPAIVLLMLIGIPVLLAAGLGKDFVAAFRLALGKEKQAGLEERKRAVEAIDLFMKVMRYGGVFLTLVQFNELMIQADDLYGEGMLGPNLAVVFIILMYAYAVNLLLLPIRSSLNVGIIEYMKSAGADGEEAEKPGSEEKEEEKTGGEERKEEKTGGEEREEGKPGSGKLEEGKTGSGEWED